MDKLNSLSYAYHYRNLDSTWHFAAEAYRLAEHNPSGRAEALNHQAFVHLARMEYGEADKCLQRVVEITGNQVQLLIAYVQQMRLCQRRSSNREFHEFRQRADEVLRRINEDRSPLSVHDLACLQYAESEYAIVNSTYYYYVGLERQSIEALRAIDAQTIQRDTAQYLNYLYNVGAGGIITHGSQQAINQSEFDHLMRCFLLARSGDYPYFAANALEALSEHLMTPAYRHQLVEDNLPALKFIIPEDTDDDLLSLYLAEEALTVFTDYGDVYQIAGAYRTLASCYRQIGDHESALFNLEQALSDSAIYQAPDLVASIREQLSVAYAAIDDKAQSDLNRNLYLDLQETTRQDRQLEARASQYERTARQLNLMLWAVVVTILLLLFTLWLFYRMNHRKFRQADVDEQLEQLQEQLAERHLRIERNERINLEQRAKVSLVNSILPLIDRMRYAIDHLQSADEAQLDYIRELIAQIQADNEVLTHWIQLRQGELSLHIESFPLQPLFDIVMKSRKAFLLKGVSLNVTPTEAVVKADRVLTLFMLNTLADNARKYTPSGGDVTLTADDSDDYVEISVTDSGQGMDAHQLAHLFDPKPIHDDEANGSHGFGLLNCKGIIEKYRKLSQIFSVCRIQAESKVGEGSRLSFRLPKGVLRLLLPLLLVSNSVFSAVIDSSFLIRAGAFADSAYYSNIRGTYAETFRYADSCRACLNSHYRLLQPQGHSLMRALGNPSLTAPEIKWFHDSLQTDYQVILDIRNESAVAALALHEWQLYTYNNRIYTQLFKELSADNTLGDYCRMMQQQQQNKTIAVILLVLLLLSIVPAWYLLYFRQRLHRRFQREQQRQDQLELLGDELRRAEMEEARLHVSNAVLDNCLSTLKHETMYYPSRIRQLLDEGDMASMGEVAAYYRSLYVLLSQQASRQADHPHLHLQAVPVPGCSLSVMADPILLDYLFELLRKQSGLRRLSITAVPKGKPYVELRIPLGGVCRLEQVAWLVCRQIVREHAEATNRHACGLLTKTNANQSMIIITLPSIWKNSRLSS